MIKKGFTLIELLIVVAIIAILAAIAVPNFLEAQTRAKVSRAKADIRTLATALESYMVDTNKYPPDITTEDGKTVNATGGYFWYMSNYITTPIAYISSNMIIDPFRDKRSTLPPAYLRFRYINFGMIGAYSPGGNPGVVPGSVATIATYQAGLQLFGSWRISSSGPDAGAGAYSGGATTYYPTANGFAGALIIYDPSNGTASTGDIVRSQKEADQKEKYQ